MARRRKTEVKGSEKSSHKYVPVRKSSRQIAKKQLEEKRINGDISQTSCSNSIEDPKSTNEDHSQVLSKRNPNSQKKHSRHKNTSSNSIIVNNENAVDSSRNIPLYKRDADESDSQDNIDNAINESKKLSPEDVQQVVVGNPNPNSESLHASSAMDTEMEVWSEDVIEETIICEEMEVEEEVPNNSYAQDGVMVEQVLLVNESNLAGKDFVEFTVIQNEDGTESMVMAPNSENASNNEYVIHKSVNSVPTSESENSISVTHMDELASWNSGNSNTADSTADSTADAAYISKKKIVLENRNGSKQKSGKAVYEKLKKEISQSISDKIRMCSVKDDSGSSNEETNCKQEGKDLETENTHVASFKEDSFSKIDNKLANMHISECSKEVQKLVHDLSSVESIDSPVQTPLNMEKLSPVNIDDESSSSILDKMEQLHRPNNSVSSHVIDIFSKTVEPNNLMKNQQDILNSNSCNDKLQCTDDVSVKSRVLQDRKSNQPKNEHLATIDEYQDSEGDNNKVDAEDIKLCSSSENSNDTLLSLTSYKGREIDVKNAASNIGDIDKKVEFRGRSGSTDTTGSESGSNSSGVRRSSRIRSIGLMKQRSRGRGLVTKPNMDVAKATLQQEKEKVVNNINPSIIQEVKVDNSEVQCDKENNSSKISTSLDTLAPLSTTCNVTGYDSDSSKPVKVKSRWRRSSELEMGGSNAGFGSITAPIPMLGSSVTFPSDPARCTVINTGESVSSESKHNITSISTKACIETEPIKDASVMSNSLPVVSTVAQIPRTIGAKISLPMVLETEDREMEERLSQFEHLRENLYLTERYTNKETKRMVCDCFLTEEEIERGELGCGEDCLNRLLMIECGPRCVVGDRCTNRRFQNCDYAKCEVFRTEKKGFGLRAVVDITAGEFIMEYVGEVVDPKDFKRRAKEYSKDKNRHYYFMALKSDQIIDATMKGNVSRFINHSCDPNAETQKWTVNGELRIGFFNKKFIPAGEEITFDYHFQRYGKEAQKCYCEAPNCRGWIGETPEEEKEKRIEQKEKEEKDDMKESKEEKKPADYMEDEDLEEEIDKLCSTGLKNRAHTLTLSRLMVRSRELEHRTRLLRLIQSGEQPCRRLFLDYHGLRLIWSYDMDIGTNESEEAQQFRLEVLKTLNTLPIPNKTMLMDSKIYGVVERWAKRLYLSPNSDSPEDDQVKPKTICDDLSTSDNAEKKSPESLNDIPDKRNNNIESCLAVNEVKSENTDQIQNLMSDLASSLLAEWSNLKEVFRIPKKERIEQMKEHEREADRGYGEELEKEEQRGTSYDRHRSDRYSRSEVDKRGDRRRGRESPETEHSRTKDKRVEERSLVPIPRMTKYERRQLFALKVAKEEEERQRRQQQESWQEHENRCLALGIDPHTSAMVDPQTGYPVFYNPTLGQWQHYSTQDGGDVTQQCTPVYVGGPQSSGMMGQNSHVLPSAMTTDISSGITTGIPPGVPSVAYSLSQTPVFSQTTPSYSLSHPQPYTEGQLPLPNSLVSAHCGTPPVSIQPPLYNVEKPVDQQFSNLTLAEGVTSRPPQPEVPPIDLPPRWKSATDSRGRLYYYHVKERISQWLPPPPDHIGVQADSSSTSESSEESSSSNEDEEDADDDHEDQKNDDAEAGSGAMESPLSTPRPNVSKKVTSHTVTGNLLPFSESKKRRDGLVQERIISPRREDDCVDHKAYKEIKEKLRRQKERAKLKDHVEKLRKHRRSNKSKSHSRHGLGKVQPTSSTSAEVSPMSERKIKDTFRINMANVMVHFLNPYRKNDCKQGRITNTEDFKHLARKLTHFVLAKELKHCKSVDELQCNENVKHKAKDFVRKYMSKFGAVYQKGTDED